MVAAALNNNNNNNTSSEEERNAGTISRNHHSHEEKASSLSLFELEKADGMTMTMKMSKNPSLDARKEQQHEQQEQKQLLLKNTAAGPHVLSSSETPTSIGDETLFSQQQRLKRKLGNCPSRRNS